MTSQRWLVLLCAITMAACNSSSSEDAGTDAGSGADSGGGMDMGHDAGGGTDMGGVDLGSTDGGLDLALGDLGSDAGCSGVLLTVQNVSAWCHVTVNGGSGFDTLSETVCVPAGSDVTLVQTAHTGFILGDWYHTDGDTGAGDPGAVSGGMSTAHETVGASGTDCIAVCCPFTGGTGCETASTACP